MQTKNLMLRNKVNILLRWNKKQYLEKLKHLINCKRLFYTKLSSIKWRNSSADKISIENEDGNTIENDHEAADCFINLFVLLLRS